MEEKGSVSESSYKNGGRATSKAIISYTKAPLDPFYWKKGTDEANFGDEDFLGDFSWPPRSYTCTFCKREFRSAQALGGHMNVHRREKARLRQITPPRYLPFLPTHLNLVGNPNPNPNPNFSTTFASNITSPFPYSSLSSPLNTTSVPFSAPFRFNHVCSSDSGKITKMKSEKSNVRVDGFDDFSREKKLENGSCVQTKIHDLDLELRLGCS